MFPPRKVNWKTKGRMDETGGSCLENKRKRQLQRYGISWE